MDIFNLSNFDSLKYESKKYQLMARYLEQLVLNRDLKQILELEENKKYKPYIKYIGGIGNSRALEFCVSKDKDERKSIALIEYIVNNLRNENKKVATLTVNGMLNTAIIYERNLIIDYLLKKPEFKNKVKFSVNDYRIVKNMTNPDNKEERVLLKKFIMEKIIPLDIKTRALIEKSKDLHIQEIVFKIDLKEKIERNLNLKNETKVKKIKI